MDPRKLYKYDKSTDTYSIVIHLDFYRDLYNEWDFSPFRNRDIDQDLIGYLEECAFEIPSKSKIKLVFNLPEKIYNEEKEQKSIKGLENFFQYSIDKLNKKRKRYISNFLLYSVTGIIFLLFAFFLQTILTDIAYMNIMPEGLFIGGWVLFWEAFEIIFFQARDIKKDMINNRRLLKSEISYKYVKKDVLDDYS